MALLIIADKIDQKLDDALRVAGVDVVWYFPPKKIDGIFVVEDLKKSEDQTQAEDNLFRDMYYKVKMACLGMYDEWKIAKLIRIP